MTGLAIVDTNLLGLLIVGSASRSYIKAHKRIGADFTTDHFELLVELLARFDNIILLPQVISETSNLIRQISYPARNHIQIVLKNIVESSPEFPVTSLDGIGRSEYYQLGVTDACILHLCNLNVSGMEPTLLSIDGDLVNIANSLGYNVIDYRNFLE